MATIFIGSIVLVPPKPAPGPPGPFWDKYLHLAAYATLALALAYATVYWNTHPIRRAAAIIGLSVLYGVGIELLQAPLPDRYFSFADVLANVVGSFLVFAWFFVESWLSYVPILQRS